MILLPQIDTNLLNGLTGTIAVNADVGLADLVNSVNGTVLELEATLGDQSPLVSADLDLLGSTTSDPLVGIDLELGGAPNASTPTTSTPATSGGTGSGGTSISVGTGSVDVATGTDTSNAPSTGVPSVPNTGGAPTSGGTPLPTSTVPTPHPGLPSGNGGTAGLPGSEPSGGANMIVGQAGESTLMGSNQNDMFFGHDGGHLFLGNQGNDMEFGGAGDDILRGGKGNDFVSGGHGDDQIWGDMGDDMLEGDDGADTFYFTLNSGNDIISDFTFSEGDRLDLQGQSYSMHDVGGSAVVHLSGGGTITLAGVSSATLDTHAFV